MLNSKSLQNTWTCMSGEHMTDTPKRSNLHYLGVKPRSFLLWGGKICDTSPRINWIFWHFCLFCPHWFVSVGSFGSCSVGVVWPWFVCFSSSFSQMFCPWISFSLTHTRPASTLSDSTLSTVFHQPVNFFHVHSNLRLSTTVLSQWQKRSKSCKSFHILYPVCCHCEPIRNEMC